MGEAWPQTTIGALLEAQGGDIKTGPFGTKLKASEYTAGGVPVVSVREVGYGLVELHRETPRVDETVTERMPEYLLRTGDVVFGRKGAVDRSAWIRPEQDGWFVGSDGIRLRVPETCNSRFLAYQFLGPAQRRWMLQHAGGSTMPSLNQGIIERIPIFLPPRSRQDEVVEILGSLDDKIELNRRTNETLEAIARALFKAWFVDFEPVRAKAAGASSFPGMPQEVFESLPSRLVESELGLIPEQWKVTTLSSLCKLEYGKALKAANRVAGHIPVIGSNGRIGWHNKRIAAGPGIVVGRKGNPGVVTWVQQDFFPIDTTFYVVPTRSYPGLAYLSFALEFLRLGRLGSDSAVPGLNRKMAYGTPLVSPSRGAAAFFEQWALQIKQAMFTLDRESKLLTETRDTLLPQLISGKLQLPTT